MRAGENKNIRKPTFKEWKFVETLVSCKFWLFWTWIPPVKSIQTIEDIMSKQSDNQFLGMSDCEVRPSSPGVSPHLSGQRTENSLVTNILAFFCPISKWLKVV